MASLQNFGHDSYYSKMLMARIHKTCSVDLHRFGTWLMLLKAGHELQMSENKGPGNIIFILQKMMT